MDKELSFLPERQKEAYLLRQEGLTYKKIGERMGMTTNGARERVRLAERRIREYECYQEVKMRNLVSVEFPLTGGELYLIMQSLKSLKMRRIVVITE